MLQEFGFRLVVAMLLLLIRFSGGVPASPSDKLWEEIGNVKTMMAAVSRKRLCGCPIYSVMDYITSGRREECTLCTVRS